MEVQCGAVADLCLVPVPFDFLDRRFVSPRTGQLQLSELSSAYPVEGNDTGPPQSV